MCKPTLETCTCPLFEIIELYCMLRQIEADKSFEYFPDVIMFRTVEEEVSRIPHLLEQMTKNNDGWNLPNIKQPWFNYELTLFEIELIGLSTVLNLRSKEVTNKNRTYYRKRLKYWKEIIPEEIWRNFE